MSPKVPLLVASLLLAGGLAQAEEGETPILFTSQVDEPSPFADDPLGGDPFQASETSLQDTPQPPPPAEAAPEDDLPSLDEPAPADAPPDYDSAPAAPGVYGDEAIAPMVIDPGYAADGCGDACGDGCSNGVMMGGYGPECYVCEEPHWCCLCNCKYFRYCRSTCNLYQHYPYFPMYHGYYYFRPYNWQHIAIHRQFIAGWGGNVDAPYSNVYLEERLLDLVDPDPEARRLKTDLPGLSRLTEDLPDLEELLNNPEPVDNPENIPAPPSPRGADAPPPPAPDDEDN